MINQLLEEIRSCTHCQPHLNNGVRPVLAASEQSKIVIIGQAPGLAVHLSGVPWDDKSGDNLRRWMGVSKEQFYNPDLFAIIPMGFCYPGTGKHGDLPPRKECAPLWHEVLWQQLINVELIVLVGSYAQHYYLPKDQKKTLTENVKCFYKFLPKYFVLPHPSPRNNIWMAKNAWFAKDVLPALKQEVQRIISS